MSQFWEAYDRWAHYRAYLKLNADEVDIAWHEAEMRDEHVSLRRIDFCRLLDVAAHAKGVLVTEGASRKAMLRDLAKVLEELEKIEMPEHPR